MRFGSAINLIHTSVLRFSAIQCAAAVPRAPAESSSSRKFEQSSLQAASETQANELTTNGHGPPASKQVSQQPKGIMGMLLSKAATKTQDTSKDTKAEAKEVTNVSQSLDTRPLKAGWGPGKPPEFLCEFIYRRATISAERSTSVWTFVIICLRSCSQVQADLKLRLPSASPAWEGA